MKWILLLFTALSSLVLGLNQFYSGSSLGLPVVEDANPVIKEEKDWNFTARTKRDGLTSYAISSKQENYLENGIWKPIDTKLTQTARGFEMTSAPFEFIAPLRSTGTALFRNDNEFDILTKKTISEVPFDKQITAVGVNDVAGQIIRGDLMTRNGLHKNIEYVLYLGAYNDADLIYFVEYGAIPRLTQLVRWNVRPVCSLPLTRTFNWQFSNDVDISSFDAQSKETRWSKTGTLNLSSALPKNSLSVQKINSARGVGHFPFQVWDSEDFMQTAHMNRNIRQIDAKLIKTGSGYTFTKIIPCDFFANAVYPVYTDETFNPNADPESTSVDGQVFTNTCTGCAWNTARNKAGDGALPTANTMRTGFTCDGVNTFDTIVRSAILFDTSSLADTFVVGSATIDLVGDAKTQDAGNADSYRIATSSPASNTDLVAGDYQKVGFTSFATADVAWADVNTDGAAETWTLNQDGRDNISVTGISKFGVVGVFDATATDPNAATCGGTQLNRVNWRTADFIGTASDPLLTVNAAVAVDAGFEDTSIIRIMYWKLYDVKVALYYFVNTAYAY